MVTPRVSEAFFRGLGVVPVIPKPERRGVVEFNRVLVKRGRALASRDRVMRAYVAALQTTRSDCVRELAKAATQSVKRAFWLENLAAVDRTLEELETGDIQPPGVSP